MKGQLRLGLACTGVLGGLVCASGASGQVAHRLADQRGVAVAPMAAAQIQPAMRQLPALPPEALQDLKVVTAVRVPPRIVPGNPGPTATGARGMPRGGLPMPAPRSQGAPRRSAEPIRPQNFGSDNLNTVYHYSDHLVSEAVQEEAPYRFSGWFVFTTPDGGEARCTASLISRSILVTAGHCVHQGGNGDAGYITAGSYYPAFRNGESPTFGSAPAIGVVTTVGWWGQGAIDQGYDVALVILNKRSGTTTEIGDLTGWYGFCAGGCLQSYWNNSQIGYPGNYYDGQLMTYGEHLEVSDTRDYLYGSGMQGGSSGGPHVTNIGELLDSTADLGQWPYRNIVFAVTSWGFTSDIYKIQGASSLTGPGEINNFPAMYNLACAFAQGVHGAATCTQL